MGWFGGLFGSKKVVDDLVDKDNGLLTQVGSWIGNFNYTDEEKSEAKAEINKGVAEFVKSTLQESTVRSRTRRSIAKLWIVSELLLVFATCVTAPIDMELAKFYWLVATSDLMFWGTMSIIGFFFGTYMLGYGSSKKREQ